MKNNKMTSKGVLESSWSASGAFRTALGRVRPGLHGNGKSEKELGGLRALCGLYVVAWLSVVWIQARAVLRII